MIETIMVIAIVGLAVFFAVRRIYKTVAGKSRDTGNCGDCCSSSKSCDSGECDSTK